MKGYNNITRSWKTENGEQLTVVGYKLSVGAYNFQPLVKTNKPFITRSSQLALCGNKINPATFGSMGIERNWTFTNTLKQRSAYET